MRIQLPKDPEAKRCVLIVIENNIGVIRPLETEGGFEYAPVEPYRDAGLVAALQKIKLTTLSMTNTPKGLAHILRLCLDAGVYENLPELEKIHGKYTK
jgi:hypothetical protein